MKKFIVVYYSPEEAMQKMLGASNEEKGIEMAKWVKWAKDCGEGMLDMGDMLMNGQEISAQGTSELQNALSGYSILQAENIEDAKKMLEIHPHLEWSPGCRVEVYEAMSAAKY